MFIHVSVLARLRIRARLHARLTRGAAASRRQARVRLPTRLALEFRARTSKGNLTRILHLSTVAHIQLSKMEEDGPLLNFFPDPPPFFKHFTAENLKRLKELENEASNGAESTTDA